MSTENPQTQNADAQPTYIDSRTSDGWTLMVRHGDAMAVKEIPYSGQRYISTENRQNRADKNSRYQLVVDDVVAHYVREEYDACPVAFAALLLQTQEAMDA